MKQKVEKLIEENVSNEKKEIDHTSVLEGGDKNAQEERKKGLENKIAELRKNKKYKGAGYRYGKAPVDELSWNHRENEAESGTSFASVVGLPEINTFAVLAAKEKRKICYYLADILDDTGGDDENLGRNLKEVSKKEYDEFINSYQGKETKAVLLKKQLDTHIYLRDCGYRGYDKEAENTQKMYDEAINELYEAS